MSLSAVFTPSRPAAGCIDLVGREKALDSLVNAIDNQKTHVALHGSRGIGKTSLLNAFAKRAQDAGYIIARVSCGMRSTFSDISRLIAAHIPLLYCNEILPTATGVEQGKTFADLLPTSVVTAKVVGDILFKIVGTRVVILLDDFDQCRTGEFRCNLAELLKNLSDRESNCQFVIAGGEEDFSDLVCHLPSAQRNLFALHLPRMTSLEIRKLIENGELRSGLEFDTVVGNWIVHIANGLPYLANLLGYFAGLRALDDARVKVSVHDLRGAVQDSLNQLDGKLSRWARAEIAARIAEGQLHVLGTLAGDALSSYGWFDANDIQERLAIKWEGTTGREFVKGPSRAGALFEPSEGPLPNVRFVNEMVIQYLWLRWVESQLGDCSSADQLSKCPAVVATPVVRMQ